MTEAQAKQLMEDVKMACKKYGAWYKIVMDHQPCPNLVTVRLEVTAKIDRQ